ncbi:shikimate dehydrogenase [Klugiella xanthotipulae]|uniref:Shikimate dehydrogenase n=1 Tax=Klugiella xanthotipulae TaxID=244735 RepID=A0A543HSA7_9MICO|nr:shikimate dehydrogenase [Klugiella xanthotipulae]TQM61213.1 shikimate dehydrogenase [Klugiella xanthotipulae]
MPDIRLGVLGFPIGHSLSPRIHAAAYAQLGLSWAYTAVACREDGLVDFVATTDWHGMSLTMPLKKAGFELADWRDPVAEASRVVNTLVRSGPAGQPDPEPSWCGYNTDVAGLVGAIREAEGGLIEHITVLGAGATSVSVILAAAQLGTTSLSVRARDLTQITPLVELGARQGLRVEPVELSSETWNNDTSLVISTIPGHNTGEILVPRELRSRVPLYDVAYDPWPSPLAVAWRAANGRAHSGVTMLLHQALMQVRIFTTGSAMQPVAHEAEVLSAMRAALPAHTL